MLAQNKKNKKESAVKEKSECEKNLEALTASMQKAESEKVDLIKNIDDIKLEKEELEKKLKALETLFVTNVRIENFKADKETKKAKDVTKTSVWFEFMDNPNAKPGAKIVHVQLLDSKGNLVGVPEKKGKPKKNGVEIEASVEQKIEYKKNNPKNLVAIKHDNKLTPGKYKVEIFVDGNFAGRSEFALE
ncbi:MAG: hypothetical protein A2X01_14305 [Bacteroidetes bacterium GWF2_35_48]|nr:MAG: hypothetical protein A2X01_14305 [Bacteroidetes bacterium GWF2_35_48]OFY93162.1 MAG: hypothetical protein A2491_14430 [Bacteroidetes bacterium RIFOXYC12_FULL_35_7]